MNTQAPELTMTIPHVTDGYTYNTLLNHLDGWYMPQALSRLSVLRRANNYRPRFYPVRDAGGLDPTGGNPSYLPIPTYGTLHYQVSITPGSYLWGMGASILPLSSPFPVQILNDIAVQVTDGCTGVKLFEDFIIGNGLQADFTSRQPVILLTQPRMILDPGDLNVSIANRLGLAGALPVNPLAQNETVVYAQFVLFCSEPCRMEES